MKPGRKTGPAVLAIALCFAALHAAAVSAPSPLLDLLAHVPWELGHTETGLHIVRGQLFRAWIQAILRREFTPLAWTADRAAE
jgi:hypothetical protein